MKRLLWVLVRIATLAIVLPLGAALPVPSAHAAGPAVSAFYSATKPDYDAWAGRKYAPPPNTPSFPSGAATVAFYFAYSGTVANQTVFVGVVQDSKGAVLITDAGTLGYASGKQMFWVTRPKKTFPDGSYKVTLTLNALPVADTTFTVGGSASASGGTGPNPGGGSGPAPGGSTVKISPFYTVSQVDFNDWQKLNYPTPAHATTYTSGKTWWIPVYFGYSGAVAKTTQYSADLRDSTGKVVATTGPYVLSYAKGQQELYIPTPNKADLADGTYTAEVVIDGQVAASTTLTVGGTAPAAAGLKVSTFYPIAEAAYNSWAKNNFPTLAQVNSFAAKTSWVPFYFAFSGAVAKSTQYSCDVRGAGGAILAASPAYTLTYPSGSTLCFVALPHNAAYQAGTYTGEVLLDQQVAATTSFSVAS